VYVREQIEEDFVRWTGDVSGCGLFSPNLRTRCAIGGSPEEMQLVTRLLYLRMLDNLRRPLLPLSR